MASNPIKVSTVLELKDLGFNENCFKFGLLTLESDRFVCIKESEGSAPSVAIIDIYKDNALLRKPMKADAAIMNPDEPIIALKALAESGCFVQVFHLETKEKIGTHHFDGNVVFWRWISKSELTMVVDNFVYHWTVGRANPTLVFERTGKLADPSTKLVGYATDKHNKWHILYGIYSVDQGATVEGVLQLYSMERHQKQLLEGYAGTFGSIRIFRDSVNSIDLLIFCERKRGATVSKLHVMDIYSQKSEDGNAPLKVSKEIVMPPGFQSDFPIAVHVLNSCGLVCILTKNGFAHFHDGETATFLFMERVSNYPLFVSSAKRVNGKIAGVLAVNRIGQVIEVSIDENRFLSCITEFEDITTNLAMCYGFQGSEKLLLRSFENYFSKQKYRKAALVVTVLQSAKLRTPETIERFKNAPSVRGQPSPALHYFSVLLEHGKLNALESLELVRPVVAQGRKDLIKKWMDDDKLTESEELGDLIRQLDPFLALKIFINLSSHVKAIMCLLDAGQAVKVVQYMRKVATSAKLSHFTSECGDNVVQVEGLPSISMIIEKVISMCPSEIVTFVNELIHGLSANEALCDISQVTELLYKHDKVRELTSILLDYLKPDLPRHAPLQTRLLELNLQRDVRVAETILQLNVLTHFDSVYIARLCEEANLYEMALQHYSNFSDIKRVAIKSAGKVNPMILEKTLKAMMPNDALEVLDEMLSSCENINDVVVSCALSMQEKIGALRLAEIFEKKGASGALFSFLRALPIMSHKAAGTPRVDIDDDNSCLVYKFIECCIAQNEYEDLEMVCKENGYFDLRRVKDLLKRSNLPNPKSIMIVCHRLGAIDELTEYLYRSGLEEYIEVYVNTINPTGVSVIVSTLFDLGAAESTIFSILNNLRDICGIKAMIQVADERHQLMLLKDWLEVLVSEGYQETEIHTALAKILVSTQNNAEEFLHTNKLYDRSVLGKFCECMDPQLALLIYSEGQCDSDMARLCLSNGLHKQLVSYALKRQSSKFWVSLFSGSLSEYSDSVKSASEDLPSKKITNDGVVLDLESDRKRICEELIGLAPECSAASEVSCALKALMDSGMSDELVSLLEQLLLNQTQFSSNRNLQNLLLSTSIKNDPAKLDLYLSKLDNYDVVALSKLATSLGLYRCSYSILKSAGHHAGALDAILAVKDFEALSEAKEYVQQVDTPELWFRLGRAYLEHKMIKEAIDAYIKSGNLSDHRLIKEACGEDVNLCLHWLREGRKLRDSRELDTDLLLYLAKSGDFCEFSQFVTGKNFADLNLVGENLIEGKYYREAVQLYSVLLNYAKLAVCHLNLGEFELASEAALKSRNPQVLRQVVEVCIQKRELKMAQRVALDLLAYQDFLPGLVTLYEKGGYFDEFISLLESAKKSVAVSTELAVAIAKFHPQELMDHLKRQINDTSSLNISKIARECCNLWLWKEAVFLYSIDCPEKALLSMILHSTLAWDQDTFFSSAKGTKNPESLYRAVHFCVNQKPLLLPQFLACTKDKLDISRLVKILRNSNCLAFARQFLEEALEQNNPVVNDTLFEIYSNEEEFELLNKCVNKYTAFDQQKLCASLENHKLWQMRSIAAKLYAKNRQFSKAAKIHYKNNNFVEAMDALNMSKDRAMALEMAKDFISRDLKEEFVACTIINFSLLDPADILEIFWIKKLDYDFIMPFLIQMLKNMNSSPLGPKGQQKPLQITYK